MHQFRWALKSVIVLLLWAAFWIIPVQANQDFYMSDALEIPLHEQASSSSKAISKIPLNAILKVIEQVESGWSLVEAKGVRGWIASENISASPNSIVQLDLEKSAHKGTREQFYKMQKENRYLVETNGAMKGKLSQLQQENYLALYDLNRLKKLAEAPQKVDQLNQQYKLSIRTLEVEKAALEQALKVLSTQQSEQVWWKIMGVLLLGLALGWIVGVLKH